MRLDEIQIKKIVNMHEQEQIKVNLLFLKIVIDIN